MSFGYEYRVDEAHEAQEFLRYIPTLAKPSEIPESLEADKTIIHTGSEVDSNSDSCSVVSCDDTYPSRNHVDENSGSEFEDDSPLATLSMYSANPSYPNSPVKRDFFSTEYESIVDRVNKSNITDKVTSSSKRLFKRNRDLLARQFLHALDKEVFHDKISESALDNEVKVSWSKSFNTTAGRATLKQPRSRTFLGQRVQAYIELSEKVVDCEYKLYNTLAHESCHLACWLIDKEMQSPHGACFKAWAKRLMNKFPSIEVTSKHNYDIDYKYKWLCMNEACNKLYQRHSKSIDPKRHVCAICRTGLLQIAPVARLLNPFQLFMKENMGNIKRQYPTLSHKEIMHKVASEYRLAMSIDSQKSDSPGFLNVMQKFDDLSLKNKKNVMIHAEI
ncbi:HMG box protein [Schizosaccharomyces cryophilus OY26]|uniref:HMG box protein n=1 Tax=Schizosaccharomyces cryophilus (strain OY26 / ATCC MYA-4695 / CBS 11777 / NBRC 106824 / NRRL Y48691) TaxID=653667 RepID=S9X725_SCHCR|nr:HMG box protein [Schizosaccharomyces cryophilus OY26]EPY52877.1 HMG box protein [Schizosaccharomyces cryophilus OY26]